MTHVALQAENPRPVRSVPDQFGIKHLSDSTVRWTAVPDHLAAAVRDATGADRVVDVVAELPTHLQQQLLHPRDGVLALALPLQAGDRVLEVASPSGSLTTALSHFGARVTRVDWCHDRLKFAQLIHGPRPEPALLVTDVRELGHLADVVGVTLELDHVLLETPRVSLLDCFTAVRECLAPRGVMALKVSRRALGKSGRAEARSLRGVVDCLEQAGLTVDRSYSYLPITGGSFGLLTSEQARRLLRRPRRAARTRGKAIGLLRAGTAWLGGAGRQVPTTVFIARRQDAAAEPLLVDRLGLGGPAAAPQIETLSDARVLVRTPQTVAKLPLSEHAERALAREVNLTQSLRRTPLARFVVPDAEIRRESGVMFAAFPYIAHRTGQSSKDSRQALRSFLEAKESRLLPLSATALMQRASSDRGCQDIAELRADALLARAHRLSGIELRCGITHGDLHPANVLAAKGHPVVVDWNRGEMCNPLLLDAVYAALKQYQLERRLSLEAAVSGYLDGSVTGPLSDEAHAASAPLSRPDAAALVLLDRVMSYSLPRRRYKPWTLSDLTAAVLVASTALDE